MSKKEPARKPLNGQVVPATPGGRRAGGPAIVERNLERYPWARLDETSQHTRQLELLLSAAGEEGKAWIVTAGEESRLPGPADVDVYVALCQLYNERVPRERRAVERQVTTTFQELITLMGRERGGNQYAAIRDSLERLADTTVRAVQTWRVGKVIAREERFNILSGVTYEHLRGEEQGGTTVTVFLSEQIAESIAAGNFRLLDTATYVALDTPTSKRLYRYLDQRRWRGAVCGDTLTVPLEELRVRLPISRHSPSHVRRTLDPAHVELIASGYLASATYDERPIPKRKRKELWVTYEFADRDLRSEGRSPARIEADRGVAGGPALREQLAVFVGAVGREGRPVSDLAWWVREVERATGDARSSGFFKQVVEAFAAVPGGLEALEFVLRGVERDGAGASAKVRGSAFTSRIKARAKELGLVLPGGGARARPGEQRGGGPAALGDIFAAGDAPGDPHSRRTP